MRFSDLDGFYFHKLSGAESLKQLDEFGLELANRNHKWNNKERETYESKVSAFIKRGEK